MILIAARLFRILDGVTQVILHNWIVGTAVMMALGVGAGIVWRFLRGPRAGSTLGVLSRRWVMRNSEDRQP